MGAAASLDSDSGSGLASHDACSEYTEVWKQYTRLMEERANVPTDKESIMKFKNSLDRVKRKMAALEQSMEAEEAVQNNNQTADFNPMQHLADAAAPPDMTLHEKIQMAKSAAKQFGMPNAAMVNQYGLGKQCHKDDLYAGVHPSYRRHLESHNSVSDWRKVRVAASGEWQTVADPLRTSVSSILSGDMVEGVSLGYRQHLHQKHMEAAQVAPEVAEWRQRLQAKQVSSFHYNAFVRDLEQTAMTADAVAGAAATSHAAATAAAAAAGLPAHLADSARVDAGADAAAAVVAASGEGIEAGAGAGAGVGVGAARVAAGAGDPVPCVPRLSYALQQQLGALQQQSGVVELGRRLVQQHAMEHARMVPDGSLPPLHANLHMTTTGSTSSTTTSGGSGGGAFQPWPQQQERWNHAADSGMGMGMGIGMGGGTDANMGARADLSMDLSMDMAQAQGAPPDWELDGTTPQYRAYLQARSGSRPNHPFTFSSTKTSAPNQPHLLDYHPFFRHYFSKPQSLVGLGSSEGGAATMETEGAMPGAHSPAFRFASRPYETGVRAPEWMLTADNPYALETQAQRERGEQAEQEQAEQQEQGQEQVQGQQEEQQKG